MIKLAKIKEGIINLIKKILKKNDNEEMRLSLIEHISEFRKRLIIVVIVFILASIISYYFVENIMNYLISLGKGYNFVYISPGELFQEYLKLSLYMGVILDSPFILYNVWKFLKPGLKKREKRSVFISFLLGLIFFSLGVFFAIKIMIPVTLEFFKGINKIGDIESMVSVSNYMSFITSNFFIFGIVFELPLVTVMLTSLGLLKIEWLVKSRRIVYLLIFIIAAVITPPNVITQILVAVPVICLFEFSIMASKILNFHRNRRSKVSVE